MPQSHVKVLTVAWGQQVKVKVKLKVKVLTVAARMSWGQHAKRKDLHTFGSLYFVPADSPEKIQVSQIFLFFNGLISNKVQPLKVVLYRIEHFHN